MPITANAKKALRQQKARTVRNRVARSQVRTMVKNAIKQPEPTVLSQLFSVVDRAVKKHLLHKNKAARIKAQVVKATATKTEDTQVESKPVRKVAKKAPSKAKKTTKKS